MRARLDAKVDQTSGTCVPDADELEPISHHPFPATEDERERGDLVWCSPCGHMYFREGIEGWCRVNPTRACPLCRATIRELIPYGTSGAAYAADRLAREAERDRAREEAREQALARIPPVQREELLQVSRFQRGIADSRLRTVERDHAMDWCTRERWRCGQLGIPPDPVLDAVRDVCIALSVMEHSFRAMLVHFVDRVELIHLCEADSTAPDDVARWRQENAELVVFIDYIRVHEPRVLNVGDYEDFLLGLEAMGVPYHVAVMWARYVSSLRGIIVSLRELDDVLAYAGRPPRPLWQTQSEFLDSLCGDAVERGYQRRI